MSVLSIDLGSTNFKACVFDASLKRIGAGSHKLSYHYPEIGHVELTREEIIRGLKACVRGALKGVDTKEIQAVSITSQAQTFSVLAPDGAARFPFISWLDRRAQATCQRIIDTNVLPDFAAHTSFGRLLAGLQIVLLKHMIEERNIRIQAGDKVLMLPAFAAHLLTGTSFLDENLAAMSGLYSLNQRNWYPPALALCGLTPAHMPTLTQTGAAGGMTADCADFGLPEGIPVIMAGNDQTAGAYGVRLHDAGDAVFVGLGTAHVCYAVVDELPQPSSVMIRGAYPGGKYYRLEADDCGANIIDWAKTILLPDGETDPDVLFHVAARAQTGADGARFNPRLLAEGGGWTNLRVTHGKAQLARAVLDSLIDRVDAMIQKVVGEKREHIRILASGGTSKAPLFLELLQEKTGMRVERVGADPLVGAARMALDAS